MVKQEDILKMLQEGADAGELAQQFADALNAAIAEKNAADAKKNAQATQKVAKNQITRPYPHGRGTWFSG